MKRNIRILSIAVLFALLFGVLSGGTALATENEQQVQFTAPVMVVNTSFLNIRSGPGIQYNVLLTVTGGTALPVLGVASDGVWYQVSTVVGVGWLNSQYAIARGDFANVPLAEAPALLDPTTVLSTGTSVSGTVSGTTNTSGTASVGSGRQWGASVIIGHPLRTGPSINEPELGIFEPDSSVIYTVSNATDNEGVNWIQVNIPGGATGWFETSKVLFRPFACDLSAVSFTQDVPLRRGPDGTGPDGDVFVSGGHEAYLLDKVGPVYKVELISGDIGWVEESFIRVRDRSSVTSAFCESGGTDSGVAIAPGVTGDTTATGATVSPNVALASVPRVVVNTAFLNIRSGPGAQYTGITTVSGGTELAVLGFAPDRVWYLVSGTFGQGWLNSEFTLFRGDGRRLPIIREAIGEVAAPTGVVNGSVTLYAAPNLTLGNIGTLTGPIEVPVVARTADSLWVQVETSLGFGWIQAEFVTLQGNIGLVPIIGG